MTDIFDTKIVCKRCNQEMQKMTAKKNDVSVRAVQCPRCADTIVHPADKSCLQHFNNLKNKTYNVKLRVVGNSHAISIPKEIITFIKEQERLMDNVVRLHLEDMHRLTLRFGDYDNA